jgi:hypothetical protein
VDSEPYDARVVGGGPGQQRCALPVARRHACARARERALPSFLRLFAGILLLSVFCGCHTAPLPQVNLSEPGWKLHEGQAVWRRSKSAPELAGELQLATHADGRAWLQFTKTPIAFVVVQTAPTGWQVHFPPQNRTYSGTGLPPSRLAWLQLTRALAGASPASGWTFTRQPDQLWRLENQAGGWIEGFLHP